MDYNDGKVLLQEAFSKLSELLQTISKGVASVDPYGSTPIEGNGREATWSIQVQTSAMSLFVEAFPRFTPRTVEEVKSASPATRMTRPNWIPLVVAPWLSPRSREALINADLNYLDLTGNVRLWSTAHPAVLIDRTGADVEPGSTRSAGPLLQGPAVGSLIRALIDFAPPFRLTELAQFTGLSQGYVSRALSTLDDERLIARTGRRITDVDWTGLIRLRAEGYDLVKSNQAMTFIAHQGVDAVYEQLASPNIPKNVVTGSFAANQFVTVAPATQLMFYAAALGHYAEPLGLLPTDRGADVFLLRPAHFNQLDGNYRRADGVLHAAASQVAIDCLAGPGRLPQEGEALLGWMSENQSEWRRRELPSQP